MYVLVFSRLSSMTDSFVIPGPIYEGFTTGRGRVSRSPELLWQVVAPSSRSRSRRALSTHKRRPQWSHRRFRSVRSVEGTFKNSGCHGTEGLTVQNRSTCSSWSKSWRCRRTRNPTMSSIPTRPAVIGGFKQWVSLPKASRVARRYLSLGAGSETRTFRASPVLRVVSSCTHLDLLAGTRPRTAPWRWLKGQWIFDERGIY